MALGHYEILRTAAITTAASPSDAPENTQKHLELQTAAIGTVGCLEELIASRLIKRLPITAVSCTALPLLLHFLDVEMSSAAADNENPQRLELMKYRLKILKSAMEVYRLQYEGVEWVSDAINQVVKLAQVGVMTDAEPSMLQRSRPESIGVSGSIEALNFQPRWYLRIAFTIDVAFSKGRLPDDAQFLRSFSGFGMSETKPPQGGQGVGYDHQNGKVRGSIVTDTSKGTAAVSSEGLHCMGEEGGSEHGVEETDSGLVVNWEDGEASQRNMETTESSGTTTTEFGTVLGQQKLTQGNVVGAGALGKTGLTAVELDIFFSWGDEGPDSS